MSIFVTFLKNIENSLKPRCRKYLPIKRYKNLKLLQMKLSVFTFPHENIVRLIPENYLKSKNGIIYSYIICPFLFFNNDMSDFNGIPNIKVNICINPGIFLKNIPAKNRNTIRKFKILKLSIF